MFSLFWQFLIEKHQVVYYLDPVSLAEQRHVRQYLIVEEAWRNAAPGQEGVARSEL